MPSPTSSTTDTPRIVEEALPPNRGSVWHWIYHGFRRQDDAGIVALVSAWTGLPFALWGAAGGLLFGAIIGIAGIDITAHKFGILGTLVKDAGGGLLGGLLGGVLGAVGGFLVIYIYLITHPLQLLGTLATGVIVSLVIFIVMDVWEDKLLELRGYRKPSRRERERVTPLLLDAASRLGMSTVPDYWISDSQKPGAWAFLRAIAVSRGLLGDYDDTENPPRPDLDDAALTAVLAHELNHWEKGDVVGTTIVTACFAPFVLIVNFIQWLQVRNEFIGIIMWIFFWPVWLCSRFIVVPWMAKVSRDHEFEADARAASMGEPYRLGLRRALTDFSAFEPPRSGWEKIIASTHPPTEARLQALEAPKVATQRPTPKPAEAKPRPRRPRAERPTPAAPVAPVATVSDGDQPVTHDDTPDEPIILPAPADDSPWST